MKQRILNKSEKNYRDNEGVILGIDIISMSLKEICGLNKVLKKEVINVFIDNMLEDKEYDVISHINACRGCDD